MNIKQIILDGQLLLLPSSDQWRALLEKPYLDSKEILSIDLAKTDIEQSFIYPEIHHALGEMKLSRQFFIHSLIKIEEELLRVHFERVICENCKNRARISATPDPIDSYIGLSPANMISAKEKAYRRPNLRCKYCDTEYNRRYTIWQKY